MKEKIGLVVCGNSGIDYMDVDFPIEVIRSTLNIDGAEYEDYIDITAEEFYDIIVENPDIDISTSQASTGKIADTYEKMKKAGYTDIITITVSSQLSGTFQGAVLAKELVEDLNVYVIDTRSVSHGQAYLVVKAIDMIKNGENMRSIIDTLEQMRNNISVYVLVDTLKYLVKNGRLSSTSGLLGTLLKIKPILHVKHDGSLVPFKKIRTSKKARSKIMEIVKKEIENKDVEVFLAHTNNRDLAVELKKELLEERPDIDVQIVPLTPVVGAHAGPGTMGIGFIVK